MTQATLLVKADDATFDFEHAMAHRALLAAMFPLTQFSVLPYLLDPSYDTQLPATKWHLNHQQAHTDSLTTLPAYFQGGAPQQTPQRLGQYNNTILLDSDLSNQDQLTWWTFANHREHYVATQTILPAREIEWRWPFW